MTVSELLAMLRPMPLTAEVFFAFEEEGLLVPYWCSVEHDHGDDIPFVRVYLEQGEEEMTWQEQLHGDSRPSPPPTKNNS